MTNSLRFSPPWAGIRIRISSTFAKLKTPGERLHGLIRRAYEQTGAQAVVIIDEYDASLLDVLHEEDRLEAVREVMQEFYQRLKMCEAMIRFCFITGVTAFPEPATFASFINLYDIYYIC